MTRKIFAVLICFLFCELGYGIEVKVSNEKELFSAERIASKRGLRPVLSARLNPAGTHIIYPVGTDESDGKQERSDLEVFDLRDSSSSRIGVEISRGYKTVFNRFNFFDPSGERLSLITEKETDPNSPKKKNGSITEVVIYDLKEKQLAETGILGGHENGGRFGSSGKWLYYLSGSGKVSLEKRVSQRMSLSGWVHSPSMSSEYSTVFIASGRARVVDGKVERSEKTGFEIWNLVTNKKVAELPVHPKNSVLDDHEANWTSDGRYVYYIDTPKDGENKIITRVWDVQGNEEKPFVASAISVGPGPGEDTMVMVEINGHQRGNHIGKMFLHFAGENLRVDLGREDMKLVHAWGGKIIYIRPDGDVGTVYAADIDIIR